MSKIKFDKSQVVALASAVAKDSKIMLVGDQGIYLMSFSQPVPRTIVYAEGCNPEVDEEWYEAKDELYGGDDGGDEICTAGDLLRIASASGKWVEVVLSATTIRVQSDGKVAAPKVDPNLLPDALKKFIKK